jgi:uncharacterized caspase-like protein/Skp family chaperone for outer membrane proteins
VNRVSLGTVLWTAVAMAVAIAGPAVRAQDRRLIRPDATSERRLALVIGNDRYAAAPLTNAANDARAVTAELRQLQFAVETVTDAGSEQMVRAVEQFLTRVQPGDVALFYYSGHGVQVDGTNYLIPIDFSGGDEVSLKFRAVNVSEIDARLERKGARVRLLVLDACRDNPFRGTRAAGGGLASYTAEGALIAFATAAGRTASDNAGAANGLFTQYFLEALRKPGLSATDVFKWVRLQVREKSGGRQVPWLHDGLIGDFVFRAADAAPVAPPPPAPTPVVAPAATTPTTAAGLRWAYAKAPGTADQAALARGQLEPLRRQLGLGLLFNPATGLLWARSALDATAELETRIAGKTTAPRSWPSIRSVAFVNLQQVASTSALGKGYNGQVLALQSKLTGDINEKQKAQAALKQRLIDNAALLNEEAKATLQRQIDEAQREIDKMVSDGQASIQALQDRLQTQFGATLTPVLDRFAGRAGVDFVFSATDSGLVFASAALDATAAVARMLDGTDAALSPFPAVRQAAYVDIQRLASSSLTGKASTAQLLALQTTKTRELEEKNKALAALKGKLEAGRAVLSDAARRQLERDIDRATIDVERATQDAQKEVTDLTTDLQDAFTQKVTAIVTQYCTAKGIDIAFSAADSAIVAGDTSLDITDGILRALDLAHPK